MTTPDSTSPPPAEKAPTASTKPAAAAPEKAPGGSKKPAIYHRDKNGELKKSTLGG